MSSVHLLRRQLVKLDLMENLNNHAEWCAIQYRRWGSTEDIFSFEIEGGFGAPRVYTAHKRRRVWVVIHIPTLST
jgi:hypothetical protein